jgi:hypothetical protein
MTRKSIEAIEKLWREKKITARELKKEIEARLNIMMVYIDPESWPKFKATISFFDSPEYQLDKYPAQTVAKIFNEKLGMKIIFCRQHYKSLKNFLRLVPRWRAEIETESLADLISNIKIFFDSIPAMEEEYKKTRGLFLKEITKPKSYRSSLRIGGHLIHLKHKQEALDNFI